MISLFGVCAPKGPGSMQQLTFHFLIFIRATSRTYCICHIFLKIFFIKTAICMSFLENFFCISCWSISWGTFILTCGRFWRDSLHILRHTLISTNQIKLNYGPRQCRGFPVWGFLTLISQSAINLKDECALNMRCLKIELWSCYTLINDLGSPLITVLF